MNVVDDRATSNVHQYPNTITHVAIYIYIVYKTQKGFLGGLSCLKQASKVQCY